MSIAGMELLKKEVLEPGLCVACGGCVGHCPHISFFDGKVVCTDACDLEEGRCYAVCPMAVGEQKPRADDEPVGKVLAIYRSRAADSGLKDQAQYGGTVTALLCYAFDKGMIDEAVLTSDDKRVFPHGIVAKTKEEIIACAGSRYTSSAVLEAFNKRKKERSSRLGVVVLPCQAQSLALAKDFPKNTDQVKPEAELTIGLFCTWALAYRPFKHFISNEGIIESSRRYDIPPPPSGIFQIIANGKTREYPLDEIREYVQQGCALCEELTAERADISVGAVEGMPDWNTLIIRTEKGKDLVERAVENGVLEVEELPDENRRHLFEASEAKRLRGKENRKKWKNSK